MFSDQNLNQYRIFYTVAELENISHAADKLYISQPAISKAISKLEDSIGTTLFIRNHRGVTLTNEGMVLYCYLRTAFDAIRLGEERIKNINMLGIGQIKIGSSATLCKYMLLPYLKKFVEMYPHIKIVIESQSSSCITKLIEKNQVDVGLVVKPEYLSKLDFYPIGEIEYVFVATQKYIDNLNLRERCEEFTDEQYETDFFKNANLMLLDEENITRQYVDSYLQMNEIEIKNVLEVNNMDLLIEFAKIGLGVACVIKGSVQGDIESGKLVEIPIVNPIPRRKIGFIYSNSLPSSASCEKFIDFYKTTNFNTL